MIFGFDDGEATDKDLDEGRLGHRSISPELAIIENQAVTG